MNIIDFIEAFKNKDTETVSSVNIKRYIPLEEKFDIIDSTDTFMAESAMDRNNSCNIAKNREICKFFDVLLAYTDITFDERSVGVYDTCMSIGVDEFILSNIQRKDYKRFCDIFDDVTTVSDALLMREIMMQIGEQNLQEDVDYFMNSIKENKEIISGLGDIMTANNVGIK